MAAETAVLPRGHARPQTRLRAPAGGDGSRAGRGSQARLDPPCPVPDVVGMQVPFVRAAREAAAAIPVAQRPAQGRRDPPRAAPDRQRLPIPLGDRHNRRVAAEPPCRLRRDRRPILDLASRDHRFARERRRVDVEDELTRAPVATDNRRQGISSPLGRRRLRILGKCILRRRQCPHQRRALLGGEPALDTEHVAIPLAPEPPTFVGLLRRCDRCPRRQAVARAQLLELGAGRVLGDLDERFLIVATRHPRQRADLAVRQPPASKPLAYERELGQLPRDAHVLARGAGPDRAPP